MRYGSKPDPMTVWLDAGCFRLTPLPPVIAVLEPGPQPRQVILDRCKSRFNLGERKVDDMLTESRPFLRETQQGHQKCARCDNCAVQASILEFECLRRYNHGH